MERLRDEVAPVARKFISGVARVPHYQSAARKSERLQGWGEAYHAIIEPLSHR